MKRLLMYCIVALIANGIPAAHAQSITATDWFTISEIYVSSATNFHFRIYGMASMTYCPSATNWAYVNEADSGEQAKIATLLMAYAMGKSVQLAVIPDSNGYCHIQEINVRG